jgi:Protein kinase domain
VWATRVETTTALLSWQPFASIRAVSRVCPTCRTAYPDAVFFCGADGAITLEEQSGADADPRIGQQLGGYIVVARVADGAMGRVYEGRHPETRARVAIKVLHAQVARDRVAVERFKREYDETRDGSWYMTMEYLQGRELSKALAGKQPLPKAAIVRVLCQTALALEHAHSYGFIHRDLKPDNVFLCDTPQGPEVRLLDFGSVKLQMETGAKLTALGTTLGSPYYMSPEQAMGASDVDQRSDVFALGAILWELNTGKVAFEAPTVAVILMKILNESPPPASSLNRESPAALDDVIDKAIRKDKKTRYESVRALAQAALAAYGLPSELETWSGAPVSEIERALSGAVPPAPKPFGVSIPAPAPAPAPAVRAVHESHESATVRGGARAAVITGSQAAAGISGAHPVAVGAAARAHSLASPSLRPAGIDGRGKRTLGIVLGIAVLLLAIAGVLLR